MLHICTQIPGNMCVCVFVRFVWKMRATNTINPVYKSVKSLCFVEGDKWRLFLIVYIPHTSEIFTQTHTENKMPEAHPITIRAYARFSSTRKIRARAASEGSIHTPHLSACVYLSSHHSNGWYKYVECHPHINCQHKCCRNLFSSL